MEDPKKPLTEAEKQILRLESLRARREEDSKTSVEKAFLPAKTQAERTIDKLTAMRKEAQRPVDSAKKRPKIEGKQKSAKIATLQLSVLDQLLAKDKRLKNSRVMRIALSRFLELDLTSEEVELETRIGEILRQMKNRP
jgi:chromatin segregation and condensation protein Rec8/ScpA/Scc1 (kleisin family)